jgi:hypothetical protein
MRRMAMVAMHAAADRLITLITPCLDRLGRQSAALLNTSTRCRAAPPSPLQAADDNQPQADQGEHKNHNCNLHLAPTVLSALRAIVALLPDMTENGFLS